MGYDNEPHYEDYDYTDHAPSKQAYNAWINKRKTIWGRWCGWLLLAAIIGLTCCLAIGCVATRNNCWVANASRGPADCNVIGAIVP